MKKLVFIKSASELTAIEIEKFFDIGFNNKYDKVYIINIYNNRICGYIAKGYEKNKEYYEKYVNDVTYDIIIDKEREKLFLNVLFTDFNEDDNVDIMFDSRYCNVIDSFKESIKSKIKVLAVLPEV